MFASGIDIMDHHRFPTFHLYFDKQWLVFRDLHLILESLALVKDLDQ